MSDLKRVTSSYKILGGFGLLILLNGLIGVVTCVLMSKIDVVELMNSTPAQVACVFVLGLQLLFLALFATQSRFIIADEDGITFINPLLPFLRSKYRWTHFDYYVTVEEYSEYATYKAVWFVKDDRLKARISSFYYSNYLDLIEQVKTESKGGRSYSPFAQLFILLRLKGVGER